MSRPNNDDGGDDGYIGPWEDPVAQRHADALAADDRPIRVPGTVSFKTLARIAVAIVLAVGLGWFGWDRYETRQAEKKAAAISEQVKESVQAKFDGDPDLRRYGLKVDEVTIVKESDHKYQGIVTVHTPRTAERQVIVEVTADDRGAMWKADPSAFMWLIGEEPSPLYSTPSIAPGWG